MKFIVLNAQTSCFIKRCYDREQCRIQTLKKKGRGGGLQNIFFGPAAINRVEGNIDTSSTRVRSREKEYESEITLVVDEQIPFLQHCPLPISVKSLSKSVFKLPQTVRPVNVIQVVLVTVVRVGFIQRGTVLRVSSDDFFWYFIRWPDLKRKFWGYSKQS